MKIVITGFIAFYSIIFVGQLCYADGIWNYYGKERYVVLGKNVNIRKEPNINSIALNRMSFGDIVYYIREKKEIVTIDGKKGRWRYVAYSKGTILYQGWVFDYYLSTFDKFDKVSEWKYASHMEAGIGDYQFGFDFTKAGEVIVRMQLYGNIDAFSKKCSTEYIGNIKNGECYIPVKMFVFNNLFLIKMEQSKLGYIYLYVDDDKKIHIALESMDSLFYLDK
jgi:hypothetical protein